MATKHQDGQPSRNEDEYFVKQDAELIRQHRAKLDAQRAKQEQAKKVPKCPRDGADLNEVEFHHVKIDRCPQCEGVWLDKGELEMLEHVDRGGRGSFIGSMFKLGR